MLNLLNYGWAGHSGRNRDLKLDLPQGEAASCRCWGKVQPGRHTEGLIMQPGNWHQEANVKQQKFTQYEAKPGAKGSRIKRCLKFRQAALDGLICDVDS